MISGSYTSALFLKLYTAISHFGEEYVVGKIDEINESAGISPDKKIEDKIISDCCRHYGVDRCDILKKTHISNATASTARSMCVVLLKKHLKNHTEMAIARIINRGRTPVNKAIRDFTSFKSTSKSKYEREFLEAYDILNKGIIAFKSDNNF